MADYENRGKNRQWCLTINNWCEEECKMLDKQITTYLVYGKEIGAENETPHLQIYMVYKESQTFQYIKKRFPRARIEPRYKDSTPLQASVYCKKEGNYTETGVLPKQGKRTDIEQVRDHVASGLGIADLIDVASNLQTIRMGEIILKYKEPARNFKPRVLWYYGITGSGKTLKAFDDYPDAYPFMTGSKWWEGYDAHENVVIDDLRASDFIFNQLLRLLDRYPMRIETKGGSRQFLARTIIITSPYHPRELYAGNGEDINQLLRRIDEIKEFFLESEN